MARVRVRSIAMKTGQAIVRDSNRQGPRVQDFVEGASSVASQVLGGLESHAGSASTSARPGGASGER